MPVINQPSGAFVRADNVQRFKFFSAFGGNFFLQVGIGKGGNNFFSLNFDFVDVVLKLVKVQLARKIGNLLFYKLVSGRDNLVFRAFPVISAEENLLATGNQRVRHNVLNPENVPERICDRL